MGLPWLRRVALLLLLAARTAQPLCLPDAVPEAERLDVVTESGEVLPLRLAVPDWDSAKLVSEIAVLISSEALGYRTERFASAASSNAAFLAVAGCEVVASGSGTQEMRCPEASDLAAASHAAFEVWESGMFSFSWVQQTHPHLLPEVIPIGYRGSEGMFVWRPQREAALNAEGLYLDIFSSYDVRWQTPWRYFDSFDAVPTEGLSPCNATSAAQPVRMGNVMRWTPDPEGFRASGDAVCDDGYWWLSPACRERPSECVPLITGGDGWWLDTFMQRAIAFRMPLSIATARGWQQYTTLPLQHRVLVYSWMPTIHFLEKAPLEMLFPISNVTAWRLGDGRTMFKDAELQILMHKGLPRAAPALAETLAKLRFSQEDVDGLLKALGGNESAELGDVACAWLHANSAKWQAWLPNKDPTGCDAGSGLVTQAGEFTESRQDAVACKPCRAGRSSQAVNDVLGDTFVCRLCQPGLYQPMWGSAECWPCDEGYYQELSGQSTCERCGRSSYANRSGSSACWPCSPGRSTDGTGFRAASDCLCPKGSFEAAGGACASCGEGASCAGFGAPPLAAPGYYLDAILPDGLSIFSCASVPSRCPGGGLHSCAPGRHSLTCADCGPGLRQSDADGSCTACGWADSFSVSAVGVVSVFCLLGLYRLAGMEDRAKKSQTSLMLVVTFSQVLATLQVVGVMARLSVLWPEPVISALQFFEGIFLKLDKLNLNCTTPVTPFSQYVLSLALMPMVVAMLTVIHILFLVVLQRPHSHALVGSVGATFMAFFITICGTALTPLQCMEHPNGRWTVLSIESVLCWETSEHTAMVWLGVAGFMFPLGFISFMIYLLSVFPARMSAGDVQFLNAYGFLFARVKPSTRWFALFFLLRNLCVAMLPSLPNAFWQTIIMQTVFFVSVAATLYYHPWRIQVMNVLDTICNGGVLIILSLSMAFVPASEASMIAEVALVVLLAVVAFFPMAVARYLYLSCRPRTKSFTFFLCHHKASAGAFARLLKMVLLERGTKGVFLDSDDLNDLSLLFDYVKEDAQHLVVICTSDVFLSHWCLGEITTAFLNHVDTLPLRFETFRPPSESQINNLGSLVPIERLTEHGLALADVQAAVRELHTLAFTELPSRLELSDLELILRVHTPSTLQMSASFTGLSNGSRMVDKFMAQTTTALQTTATALHANELVESEVNSSTLLLADWDNREAIASALILQKLLVPLAAHTPQRIPRLMYIDMNDDSVLFDSDGVGAMSSLASRHSVRALSTTNLGQHLILCCTAECFSSMPFLLGLCHAMRLQVSATLTVVASDQFQFPTEAFYHKLEVTMSAICDLARVSRIPGLLTEFVRGIFEKISSRLTVLGSHEILSLQSELIWKGLKRLRNEGGLSFGEGDPRKTRHASVTLEGICHRCSVNSLQQRRPWRPDVAEERAPCVEQFDRLAI